MFKNLNNKTLDDLNYKILRELSENARISTVEIGRRIGLSSPAVAERIEKMEEYGFITGYHASVDFDKIGLTVRAFITIRPYSSKHNEMIETVDSIPEVIERYTVTGNTCLWIKVVASSSKELENVIQRLQSFGETSTSLILSESSPANKGKKLFDL